MLAGWVVGNYRRQSEGRHEGRVTTKKHTGWEQLRIILVLDSEGRTLRVLVGRNRPTSWYRRFSCRKVEKTYGREAARLEPRLSRWPMIAL